MFQRWPKRDPNKHYYLVPNEVFNLGLSSHEIAVYNYAKGRGGENRRLYGIGNGNDHAGASRPAGAGPVQGDSVREGGVSNVKQPQIEATLSAAVHIIAYQD